jgi:AcrR family transcriptional regulator
MGDVKQPKTQRAQRPGRRPRARVARGEGRGALCQALARVVARDGFEGVTFRSVAAEAGVTHGLASYHFGTREAMIHEALSWAVRRSIESAHLAAGAGGISEFAEEVPGVLAEAPEEAIFQFEVLLRALRTPALRDDVVKSYDEYIAAVAQSLRSVGIDSDAVARLVFAALDGLTLQQLLYGDERRTHEAIAALRRLLSLLAAASDGGRVAAAEPGGA